MQINDPKFLLEDVRARDIGLLNLILFNDRQAMQLFRIYVTIGSTAAVAAAAGLFGNEQLLQSMRFATTTITVVLAIASWMCVRVMAPVDIANPGKSAEFWQWAMDDRVDQASMLTAYLSQAKAGQDKNRKVNENGAKWLTRAKRLGIAAPLLGLLAEIAVLLWG